MESETLLILPPRAVVSPHGGVTHATPYGTVTEQAGVLIRTPELDARALVYAAKAAGARRILAGDLVQPISPLLEAGDLLVPADVIDRTRLRPATFFAGKGYGFIRLAPPFCPVAAAALVEAGRAVSARTFRGAAYVGSEGPRAATAAELRMYRQWGGDVVGTGLLPEAFLARELELCYVPLAVVADAESDFPGSDGERLLSVMRAAAALPSVAYPDCACGQSMAAARAQGLIGPDWRTWLSDSPEARHD